MRKQKINIRTLLETEGFIGFIEIRCQPPNLIAILKQSWLIELLSYNNIGTDRSFILLVK